MIKVTDFIAKKLKEYGVEHVFMVTGGGAMHLNDSLGREFSYICNHHEQACAIAAEGYYRASSNMAVVNVTTGPGGLNTLNGVLGQWTDSVPVLYISGQVKFETTIASCREIKGLRQLGDQEVDIVKIVSPITKYAKMVTDPATIGYDLEEALYRAKTGRPGPVWLDIPMNVQGALIDEDTLDRFTIPEMEFALPDNNVVEQIVSKLSNAKRPVILAGQGIRIAGGIESLKNLLEKCNIPVVTTFNGMDLLKETDSNYVGRFGTLGTRAGNFCVQNADVLLTIGTRNNIRQVSYNWEFFAPDAFKIIVDIDQSELDKPTIRPDLAVCCDAKSFLDCLSEKLPSEFNVKDTDWLKWNKDTKLKYPSLLPEYLVDKTSGVHPYVFMYELGEQMNDGTTCVAGDGTACVVPFQVMPVLKDIRIFWNSGCASMGYDLPAAIGASVATQGKQVVCLAGDGSIQMNIQELQTVIHYQLPIKIFYLNNNGYISIKQTQDGFFNGHRVGSDPSSGVSFPDIKKLGAAYGFKVYVIDNCDDLAGKITEVLQHNGPVLCEVVMKEEYKFQPKLSSRRLDDGRMVSSPLEDLSPFLDRDELRSNMFTSEYKN